MGKRIQNLPKKASKSPKPTNTYPEDSDDEESDDSEDEEPRPQKASPWPVTQPAKNPGAASRTLVTSCTYILTYGVRKGKQSNFKAPDKTDKFCRFHKWQPSCRKD